MLPLDLAHVDRRFLSWLCLEMFLGVCEVLSTASANAVLYNLTHWQECSVGPFNMDLELKKAFTELQAKVIDTQQKVKLADIQIEQLNRTKKHAHLTDTEIMTLVDETNMYEGVGRMFILQSKEVIHNQLLEKQKIAEEKIKELEQKKSYLERSVKEAEDNIREMLMARRAQ